MQVGIMKYNATKNFIFFSNYCSYGPERDLNPDRTSAIPHSNCDGHVNLLLQPTVQNMTFTS